MIRARMLTACAAAVVVAAGLASAVQAHGMGGQGGGMMGPGQGRGEMMGPSQGGGMMGQGGMMGPSQGGMMGMMGQRGGMSGGPGAMGRNWMGNHLPQDLTADSVRHILSMHIAARGNDRLKVGEVTERDDDTIVAEIVTVDDSLVHQLLIDRHTGFARRAGADDDQ